MGIVKTYQRVVSRGGFDGVLNQRLQQGSAGYTGVEQVTKKAAYKYINATQIKALNSTPQTLIPAPGAGKLIVVHAIHGKCTFGTAAFTGSNAVEFRYTNGSGDKVIADFPTAWLNISSSIAYRSALGIVTTQTPVANAAIVVYVPTANPGGASATGYVELVAEYSIIGY